MGEVWGIDDLFPKMITLTFPVIAIGGELSNYAENYLQTHPAVSAVISADRARRELLGAGISNVTMPMIQEWIVQQLKDLEGKATEYVIVSGLDDLPYEITSLTNFRGVMTTSHDDFPSHIRYPRLHCRNLQSLHRQLDFLLSPISILAT